MSELDTSALFLTDPAAAIRLRRMQQAQALVQQGADASPIRSHWQGAARLAQALLGGIEMRGMEREAKEQGERYRAEAASWNPLAMSSALLERPAPTAPAGSGSAAPDQAPPIPPEQRRPVAAAVAGVPAARPAPGSPPPGMYGRNAGAAAARDALLDAPPEALAAASQARATATNGLPPGTQFRAHPGLDGAYAGLPAPSGQVPALGDPRTPAALQPSGTPQPGAALPPGIDLNAFAAQVAQGMNSPNPLVRRQAQAYAQMLPGLRSSQERDEDRHIRQSYRAEDAAWRREESARAQGNTDRQIALQVAAGQREATRIRLEEQRLGSGPFQGQGMDAQAGNILMQIGPRIADGTATPQQRQLYGLAYSHVTAPTLQQVPDPQDPSRTVLAQVPRSAPQGFPSPDFQPPQQRGGQAAPPAGAPPAPAGPQAGQGASALPPAAMPAGGAGPAPQSPNGGAPQQAPGVLQTIPGTSRPGPAPQQQITGAMLENVNAVRKVDQALGMLEQRRGQGVGFLYGVMPDAVSNRVDPGGTALRALVADIGSLKIHDRSGAAVSASEFPRLRPFIPSVGDNDTIIRSKLTNFRREYEAMLRDQYSVFGPQGGGRALAPVEQILNPPSQQGGTEPPPNRPPLSSFEGR